MVENPSRFNIPRSPLYHAPLLSACLFLVAPLPSGAAESCGFHTLCMPGMWRPASAGKCYPGVQVQPRHLALAFPFS